MRLLPLRKKIIEHNQNSRYYVIRTNSSIRDTQNIFQVKRKMLWGSDFFLEVFSFLAFKMWVEQFFGLWDVENVHHAENCL